ncbi:LuxR C-terminal-related transcriptional regulator [Actinosynnema sp. NPDC020468]|uniref:helix-turn-helix transcriptional regulator n=1 Tax=Actinosynnema sp. NPDC020468 TaxID=3154488 RepID=UPI0033FE2FFB
MHNVDSHTDAERRLAAVLTAARRDGRGAVVLVEGEPGIGRTELLADAVRSARDAGIATRTAGANELTHLTALAPLAEALGEPVWDGNPMRLAATLRDRVTALAAAGPLLIALDDLQWADPMTLAALQSFAGSGSAVWLLACCDGVGEATAVGRLFDRLEHSGATRIRLRAWGSDRVTRYVTDFFDAPPDDELTALVAGANGNPALLSALLHGLREENAVTRRAGHVVQATDALPDRLRKTVRARLDGCTQDTVAVLEVAAVLGTSFRVADVADVLGRSPADVLRSLRHALRAGLVDGDRGDTLTFRHPLVWQALRVLVAPSAAAALHRQVGLLLLRRNTSAVVVTDHLLRGALPGDAEAVTALVSAATAALDPTPGVAVDIARKAQELAVPGGAEHHALTAVLATGLLRLGRLGEVADLVGDRLATGLPTAVEAGLRSVLAVTHVLGGRHAAAAAQAEQVLVAGDVAPATRRVARATKLVALRAGGQDVRALAEGVLEGRRPDAPGSDVAVATAGLVLAQDRWDDGDLAAGPELLGHITPLWTDLPAPHPALVFAARFADIGDLDRATAALAAAEADIARTGGLVHDVPVHVVKAWVRLRAGDTADAIAHANAGLRLSADLGVSWMDSLAHNVLATDALRRGDLVRVRERLDSSTNARTPEDAARLAWVDVRVEVERTDPTLALATVKNRYAGLLDTRSLFLLDPAAAAWLARVAIDGGDRGLAGFAVAAAEELAAANVEFPTLAAAAAHARGLFDRDPIPLRRAVSAHGDPWSRGSAAEDLAVVSQSRGVDTADVVAALDTAMREYRDAGATGDQARVRKRLREVGVRRRHWIHAERPASGWDSLTTTEREVAHLVTEGLTNRQVAARMFVSPHTVHAHLGRVFRKLGVNSRVELTGLRHQLA